jgi:hypothetical protein
MRFDLRWKHALGLGLEDEGLDATVLCHFRRKLLDSGLERALFERLVNAEREAGLITKNATQLLDSSHILGAAGARDTYALIRGCIRESCSGLWATPLRGGPSSVIGSAGTWTHRRLRNPRASTGATPKPAQRDLKEVVADARSALSLVEDATTTPAACEAVALLEKIVSDDVEEGPPPGPKRRGRSPKREKEKGRPAPEEEQQDSSSSEDPAPRLRRGVAKDRVLSVVDPQMRVGHKSKRQSWAGYKVHIAEEPQS